MLSTSVIVATIYLVIGIIAAEVCVRTERKRGIPHQAGAYLIVVVIWPAVIYMASKRW